MNSINLKKEIFGTLEMAIESTTAALKTEGFGVLTRIDFHSKMKEKLGKDMRAVVILGACNPELAFEAYQQNSDVAGLLPCNAVIREISDNRFSIELTKPSVMMKILGNEQLYKMAIEADTSLQKVLEKIQATDILEWSVQMLSDKMHSCEMIDVRSVAEFEGPLSHVEGSKLVTLGADLDRYLAEKSKSPQQKPIVFICRSGIRSMNAALQARELGLNQVINLKGGMIAWNEAEFPTHHNKSGGALS